jgi:predicted nucleic acid-binding protein
LKGIADTGFLVAFANRRDRYHDWAVSLAEQITEPLLTCEAVLAEAAFHLQDTWLVLEMVSEGLVRPALKVSEELPHLLQLAHRYRDRNPDLADLCVIRMSELYPEYSVITVDVKDFRVYRRNKRERISLITPV